MILEYESPQAARRPVKNITLARASPLAGRLGWDTYVQSRPQQADRCDVRYDVEAAVAA